MSFRTAKPPIDLSSKAVYGMEYDRDTRLHEKRTGKSMYGEIMEMGAVAFSTYTFGIIRETARKAKEDNKEFVGLKSKTSHKPNLRSSVLSRTYTPQEIKQLVLKNWELLHHYFPGYLEGDRQYTNYFEIPLDVLSQMTLAEGNNAANEDLIYTPAKEGLPKDITTRGQEKSVFEESFRTVETSNRSELLESIPESTESGASSSKNNSSRRSWWKKKNKNKKATGGSSRMSSLSSLQSKMSARTRTMSFQELWHPINEVSKSSFQEEDPMAIQARSSMNIASNSNKEKQIKKRGMGEAPFQHTRPITFQDFDDDYQEHEVVYGIVVDKINKRVILTFRGTDNLLAAHTNWTTNVNIIKDRVALPECLKGKVDVPDINLHSGFYDYLFEETVDPDDADDLTKFDEIVLHLMPLLNMNPGYELYVTGHSLGGAVSTLAAFFLSCHPGIPKPVKNISFAAPRCGGRKFLKAVQYLEKTRQLQILRCLNHEDSIAVMPMIGYVHVGCQITMYVDNCLCDANPPDYIYPNLSKNIFSWTRVAWKNSLIRSLNLRYDHADYLPRVELAKEFLVQEDWDSWYKDSSFVGYELEDEGAESS